MARRVIALLLIVAVSWLVSGCVNLGSLLAGEMEQVVARESPRWLERKRVALVDVDGFIASSAPGFLARSVTTVADVRERLDRAARDGRVRAVVLRVNSPGGEVSASDTIYREVLRFRHETGKPVVAALTGTATSGAYYVALAADCIVAAPTTVTGSVGVIMELVNVEGLFGKVGLRPEVFKSGEKKDIGSPTRTMTEEERRMLAGVIDELFGRFVGAVRERRPAMTEADLETVSDGRVLTASQALELGLVDRIGYLDDALDDAYALAGIRTADVILYRPFRHYNANIYARGAVEGPAVGEGLESSLGWARDVLLGRGSPAFLYLWCPGP